VANPFEYTVNGEAATIVVLAGETIQPIVPGSDPIPCDTPADATNAVEVINAIKTHGTAVMGDGTSQKLTKPAAVMGGTKAFFKVCVGVAQPK